MSIYACLVLVLASRWCLNLIHPFVINDCTAAK